MLDLSGSQADHNPSSLGYLRGYAAGFAEQLSVHQWDIYTDCLAVASEGHSGPSAHVGPLLRTKRTQGQRYLRKMDPEALLG